MEEHFQIAVNEITHLKNNVVVVANELGFGLFIIYCITNIDIYIMELKTATITYIGWYFTLFSTASRETDVLFEVLFDEEFLGGLTIRFVQGVS